MKPQKRRIPVDTETFKHQLFNLSEVQAIYKPTYKMSEKPVISSSREIYNILMQVWDQDTIQYLEYFYLILLNRANRVLGISPIAKGGVSGVVVDPKVIFTTALLTNSSAIVIAHNHPSGNLKPSEADISVTKKVHQAAQLLDMQLIDHLIVTTQGYVSFADEGWIS